MPEPARSPFIEALIDYGVYAPIGLGIELIGAAPRLKEKGRAKLTSTFQVAGMFGRLAAAEGRRRVERVAAQAGERVAAQAGERVAAQAGAVDDTTRRDGRPTPSPDAQSSANPSASSKLHTGWRADKAGAERPRGTVPNRGGSVDVGSLAIPGYDTLAASQIVQRLSSLEPTELAQVRRYEEATRGRRTVLHRIAQLSADRDNGGA
ncbi:MAG: hypothetical protein ACRDZ5_03540 [Acidimicrobiales bacterium]